ncbi:MAG: type II toxin-antitoxin system HicB family antitoxin [Chloroherpetonaceae bacterium]
MKALELPIVVSFEEDTYIARCPLIQGAFAEGDTPQEATKELAEVIELILDYRQERGDDMSALLETLTVESDKIVTTITIGR